MKKIGDLFAFEEADDPNDEGLEDVNVSKNSLSSSVIYNTDWTVETVVRQVSKGTLDMSPRFQRRDAWTVAKKSLLIESILLNFPVPPLTLAERGASKNFIVVDGKQRLNTLSQFFGLMHSAKNNLFRLTGLQQLPDLNGSDIEGLRDNFPAYIDLLENYAIRTNVVRGWKSDNLLYNIFLRLNSGSVKLSPQELRQALKPGPFSDFLSDYTENSPAMRSIFPGSEPDFRMRDLELMNRYIGFQFFITEYRGDLKKFLDLTAEILNSDWDRMSGPIKERALVFEDAYLAVLTAFGPEAAFRKWNGERWENRLNRAVFDVMVFFLRDRITIERFESLGAQAVSEFIKLCENDLQFRNSIETTTKSTDAVFIRLQRWGHVLLELGVIQPPLELNVGSIEYVAE